MIYNKAHSAFAGGAIRISSKVRKGWPEVAAFNDNVMRAVPAGGVQELTFIAPARPNRFGSNSIVPRCATSRSMRWTSITVRWSPQRQRIGKTIAEIIASKLDRSAIAASESQVGPPPARGACPGQRGAGTRGRHAGWSPSGMAQPAGSWQGLTMRSPRTPKVQRAGHGHGGATTVGVNWLVNGRPRHIPLSPVAVAVLERQLAQHRAAEADHRLAQLGKARAGRKPADRPRKTSEAQPASIHTVAREGRSSGCAAPGRWRRKRPASRQTCVITACAIPLPRRGKMPVAHAAERDRHRARPRSSLNDNAVCAPMAAAADRHSHQCVEGLEPAARARGAGRCCVTCAGAYPGERLQGPASGSRVFFIKSSMALLAAAMSR